MAARHGFTAADFAHRLGAMFAELEAARKEHEERVESCSRAEVEHGKAVAKLDVLKAQAFLAAEGNIPEREARADIAIEDEAYELAELKAKLSLETGLKISSWGAVQSAQLRIEALRSLASAYRAEPE